MSRASRKRRYKQRDARIQKVAEHLGQTFQQTKAFLAKASSVPKPKDPFAKKPPRTSDTLHALKRSVSAEPRWHKRAVTAAKEAFKRPLSSAPATKPTPVVEKVKREPRR